MENLIRKYKNKNMTKLFLLNLFELLISVSNITEYFNFFPEAYICITELRIDRIIKIKK